VTLIEHTGVCQPILVGFLFFAATPQKTETPRQNGQSPDTTTTVKKQKSIKYKNGLIPPIVVR
jgi:hypothetical protein